MVSERKPQRKKDNAITYLHLYIINQLKVFGIGKESTFKGKGISTNTSLIIQCFEALVGDVG